MAKLTVRGLKMELIRLAIEVESNDIADDSLGWLPEFTEVRTALKRAILRQKRSSADEQHRIAAILLRAITDIEGTRSV